MQKQGLVLGLGLLCAGWLNAPVAHAQAERNSRIELHPVETQVGIVSRTIGKTAWVAFPRPVKTGAEIAFSAYSDGGDTLAAGTVRWAASVAPYEAYVTEIHTVTTRHEINEFDDYFTIGALTRRQVSYGASPDSNPMGVNLCAGFYARTPLALPPASAAEEPEPVRAHIAALRTMKTKLATDMATAAEKALGLDPTTPAEEQLADYAVNYSALADNLRAFSRLKFADPITEKILNRLLDLARNSGHASSTVPANFFRPPSQLRGGGNDTGTGTGTGTGGTTP